MQRILNIVDYILLNLALVFLSVLLYLLKVEQLLEITAAPKDITTIVSISIILIGVFVIFVYPKLIRVAIGGIALTYALVLFLMLYSNHFFSKAGQYEDFVLIEAQSFENDHFLKVEYFHLKPKIAVTMEKCFSVDSVQIRVDNGLFGMKTISNQVRIKENSACNPSDLDTFNLISWHQNMGDSYSKMRCFDEAEFHYSACLKLDSLHFNSYCRRGNVYLIKENYQKALNDYISGAMLRFSLEDSSTKRIIANNEVEIIPNDIYTHLKNKDLEKIDEFLIKLDLIADYDKYVDKIAFCLKKIKEGNKEI